MTLLLLIATAGAVFKKYPPLLSKRLKAALKAEYLLCFAMLACLLAMQHTGHESYGTGCCASGDSVRTASAKAEPNLLLFYPPSAYPSQWVRVLLAGIRVAWRGCGWRKEREGGKGGEERRRGGVW